MKFINTEVHSLLDYIVGILLISAPWMIDLPKGSTAQTVPIILGAVTILLSAFTRYEGGLVKVVPVKMHLMLDVFSAVLLAISPWLFGFADTVYVPYLAVGIFEILVVSFTDPKVKARHTANRYQ